ncbi:MAG: hypothetical protein AABY96_03345 [Nitrospirota bacterium]
MQLKPTRNFFCVLVATCIVSLSLSFTLASCAFLPAERHYREAQKKDTVEGYRAFLQEYPDKYFLSKDIRGRLEQLEYENAQKAGTVDAYRAFARSYPEFYLKFTVQQEIRRLEMKALLARLSAGASYEGFSATDAARIGAAAWNGKTYDLALKMLQHAVNQGHAGSNFGLAIMFWHSQGVTRDFERAIRHMRASPGQDSMAETMEQAYEISKANRSCSPVFEAPRGSFQIVNDGTCLRLAINPSSLEP